VTLWFVYQLLRRMFGLVRTHRPDAFSKEAEILVLRHQLACRAQARDLAACNGELLSGSATRRVTGPNLSLGQGHNVWT
jgi:hypothetical protein